jgi:two-component system, NtrC family, response regulator AtoC
MSEKPVSVLVVSLRHDTERQLRSSLSIPLGQISRVSDGPEALEALERSPADLVVVDSRLNSPALDLLRAIQNRWPGLPVVLLAEEPSLSEIAAAASSGASDLLTQPVAAEELAFSVQKALAAARRVAAAPPPPTAEGDIVFGRSPAMQTVRELLTRVAASASTVLVRGESGTGKELIARALHRLSARAQEPLIKIDCTSLPENLLESELFGYEKGAFTGAVGPKLGRVELANHGTLFLDEVGELSLTTQAKLLRLLQDREFERLGGTKTIHVDVRMVAATHRDLETMVQQGSFRADLFYRLNIVPLWIAPLRARRVDIEDLARHFCAQVAAASNKPELTLSEEAIVVLMRQRWPGNVRQLQNFVERLVVLGTDSQITAQQVNAELGRPVRFATETGPAGADAADLPLAAGAAVESGGAVPLGEALRIAERQALHRALQMVGGNRSAAARLLAVSRSTLYLKLQEYGLL